MPQGLEIRDASGQVQLSTSDAIVCILGTFITGGAYPNSGTIVDSRFLLGDPVYFIINIEGGSSGVVLYTPSVAIVGDTLSYNWLGNYEATQPQATIIYGLGGL